MDGVEVKPSAIDPPEIENMLWEGWSGELAFDVGGNAGQSVAWMLKGFARIVTFEPCQESWQLLHEAYRGHSHVVIRAIAISDHDGAVELAVVPLPMETGQLVTPGIKGMEWEPPDWSAVSRRSIPCRKLDSLTETYGIPDFVKVDTEGHEVQVLAGATALLATGKPSWLVEFHSPENQEACQIMLVQAGYRVRVLRHPHYTLGGKMWYQHGWLKAVPPA